MKIKYSPHSWAANKYEETVEDILKNEGSRFNDDGQIERLDSQVKHLTEALARFIEKSKHLTAPEFIYICTGSSDDTATFVP